MSYSILHHLFQQGLHNPLEQYMFCESNGFEITTNMYNLMQPQLHNNSFILSNYKMQTQSPLPIIDVRLCMPEQQSRETRQFSCTFPGCLKTFSKKFCRDSHLKIHSKEKQFVCKCERHGKNTSFKRLHDFYRHVRCVHKTEEYEEYKKF